MIYTLKYPFPPITLGSEYESSATAITSTILNPGVFIMNLFIKYLKIKAIKTPDNAPTKSCKNSIPKTLPTVILPDIMLIAIIVSIYAKGSLLPLSTSKIDAVLYLRFRCLSRNIENTLAASVEEITAPVSTEFIHENFRTK